MSNINLYEQTLNDLELRRGRCLEDIRKIEAAIASLRAAMDVAFTIKPVSEAVAVDVTKPVPAKRELPPWALKPEPQEDPKQRFASMSVRWAILKLLAQFTIDPLRSSEIADALQAGGNPKASRPTVSAIMSDMVNKRGEAQLEPATGGYFLTHNGLAAWSAIEHSERYINRAAYANEQQQPA